MFSTNLSSIRALEKNGFEQEGYFRKGVYKEGQFVDQVVYAKVV
ncbi:GNAT family N-acetyltransferase [Acaryochloris sp. CCMEE 5410]|nr:GNAT family protein [Acaryochloris sp. CCMEE 5410]KAI9133316.1 GNAT family N-acetyltransferase [Acaryochloris sp. CCMEE 5410]